MQDKFSRCASGIVMMFSFITSTHAIDPAGTNSMQAVDISTAIISAPEDIAVGRTIILDASASHVTGERTQYVWSIDETKQVISRSVEAVYTPERTGKLTFRLIVKSTDLTGKILQEQAIHPIVVFKRKIVLITDTSVSMETLGNIETTGLRSGVFVKIVRPAESTSLYRSEDAIATILSDQKQLLLNAESIILWTKGIAGLQALMRAVHGNTDLQSAIRNQTIILLTDRSLSTLARSTRGAFTGLHPVRILLTQSEALTPLMTADSSTELHSLLQQRGIDSLLVNGPTSLRPWDVLSILVNYLLFHGVSGQTVILLLMLPVIASIFSFLKQVIGITSFGLYASSIVALSFLALGWGIGLFFLLFILVTSYFTRSLMKKWRLLYIPKVAIILIVVSFMLLFLVAIGTWFGLTFSRDTVFILLMLSTQAETFLNLKTEEGWAAAILGVTETSLGALLCVFIVQWQLFQSTILAYPELILITIAFNVYLGRWTGLRFVEYFRFKEVFKHLQEEE